MSSVAPLIRTCIAALDGDAILQQQLGVTNYTYAYEAPDDTAFPFLTIEPVAITPFAAADFDGDDVQFRVYSNFKRGGDGDSTGMLDALQANARVRAVLEHRAGFNLPDNPTSLETLTLDMITGPVRETRGAEARLVLLRYVGSEIVSGLMDRSETPGQSAGVSASNTISGVVTFRALISPAN